MESEEEIDKLTKSCSNISITPDEDDRLILAGNVFEKVKTGGRPSLLGKLITLRPYNKAVMISYLKSSWHTAGWIRFKELWDDVFLIQFEKTQDKECVMVAGPLIFSKSLFVTKDVEGEVTKSTTDIDSVSLWVHLFGLPPLGFTKQMGMEIGARLGAVLEVDDKRRVCWKWGLRGESYMRVRISLCISKRLLRGIKVSFDQSSDYWIAFRYEKLANFCFCCGQIGHVLRDCKEPLPAEAEGNQYGDWLRATSDVAFPFKCGAGGVPVKEPTIHGIAQQGQGCLSHMEITIPQSSESGTESLLEEQLSGVVTGPGFHGDNLGVDNSLPRFSFAQVVKSHVADYWRYVGYDGLVSNINMVESTGSQCPNLTEVDLPIAYSGIMDYVDSALPESINPIFTEVDSESEKDDNVVISSFVFTSKGRSKLIRKKRSFNAGRLGVASGSKRRLANNDAYQNRCVMDAMVPVRMEGVHDRCKRYRSSVEIQELPESSAINTDIG